MKTQCERCGSYAINNHMHGRDGTDTHLCDVCFWRKRAKKPLSDDAVLADVRALCDSIDELNKDSNGNIDPGGRGGLLTGEKLKKIKELKTKVSEHFR